MDVQKEIERAFLCFKQGAPDKTVEILQNAIQRSPDNAELHQNLGMVLYQAQQNDLAEVEFRKAIELKANFAKAYNNLGLVLKKKGDLAQAEAQFKKALEIEPEYTYALSNLGIAFLEQRKFELAAQKLQKAADLMPNLLQFHNNLGNALMELGRFDEALVAFGKAIEIDPQAAQPHHNRSLILLMKGNFKQGWKEYEWRWKNPAFSTPARPFGHKIWDGSTNGLGKLLVWAEQGIGDEVQFSMLLPLLIEKDIDLVIECDKRLVSILQRSLPKTKIFPRTDPPAKLLNDESITHQIPMCSLPLVMGWPLKVKPHILADDNLRNDLRNKYKNGKNQFLVGISFKSGNTQQGPQRSIDLQLWDPILKIPGTQFVSLQYGKFQKELQEFSAKTGIKIIKDESVNPLTDLESFVAQVAAMDLIISVDNSTVHFSAALGIKTWTLLPTVPDWRWGLNDEKICWYPSMRLFRQERRGDWAPVIDNVAAELSSLIQKS